MTERPAHGRSLVVVLLVVWAIFAMLVLANLGDTLGSLYFPQIALTLWVSWKLPSGVGRRGVWRISRWLLWFAFLAETALIVVFAFEGVRFY